MSTYTPIATQTLGSAAASVTFSSIPQGYTDLIIVVGSATFSANSSLYFQYNGDTGTNYSSTRLTGNGTSATSNRISSSNGANIGGGDGLSSSAVQTCTVQLQNYSSTTIYKTALARWSRSDAEVAATVSLWRSTAAITSIEVYGGYANGTKNSNMQTGTTISIYGIQVGDKAQKAQGGNVVTSDGTYVYHTFTSSGSFIPSAALTVDYLVVAGGGGGGGWQGGGGGAGGLRSTVTATGGGGSLETALSLSSETGYTVTVGAGGAGNTYTPSLCFDDATNGSNSVFSTITSTGGGKGGGSCNNQQVGANGGSGGGATYDNVYGTGTTNQGRDGGQGYIGNPYNGGGGGGASVAGGNASIYNGGTGGNGVAVAISGSSVTYAGGGGGGTAGNNNNARTGGTGGTGGGGAGGNSQGTGSNSSGTGSAGTSGTVNLGAGGGGAGYGTNSGSTFGGTGGNGGSGIVILRYAI